MLHHILHLVSFALYSITILVSSRSVVRIVMLTRERRCPTFRSRYRYRINRGERRTWRLCHNDTYPCRFLWLVEKVNDALQIYQHPSTLRNRCDWSASWVSMAFQGQCKEDPRSKYKRELLEGFMWDAQCSRQLPKLEKIIESINVAVESEGPITRRLLDEMITGVELQLEDAARRKSCAECGSLQAHLVIVSTSERCVEPCPQHLPFLCTTIEGGKPMIVSLDTSATMALPNSLFPLCTMFGVYEILVIVTLLLSLQTHCWWGHYL